MMAAAYQTVPMQPEMQNAMQVWCVGSREASGLGVDWAFLQPTGGVDAS